MLRRIFCLLGFLLLLLCPPGGLQSRTDETPMQPRILLLVDGSSSMLQPWNKTIRFKAAGRIISAFMDSIYAVNPDVEFALRVYGHQSPAQANDCFDSKLEVMFSRNNMTQMGLRMASIRPFGVSPIAYSLKEAATNDLVDEARNAYAIILITDGGESCGGNICDVVKQLIERKIFFKPYILSLVSHVGLKDQYSCLGNYLQVTNDAEMGPALKNIVDAYRPVLSMPIIAAQPPETTHPIQKPEIQKVPVPVVTAPSIRPEIGELPRLGIVVTTKQVSVPVKTFRPQRRALQSNAGTVRFAAEPVEAAPRSELQLPTVQPSATKHFLKSAAIIRPAPKKAAVPRMPKIPVETDRSQGLLADLQPTASAGRLRTAMIEVSAPKKRSIPTLPKLAPSELDRIQEPVATLQSNSAVKAFNIKAIGLTAPKKRSIPALPKLAPSELDRIQEPVAVLQSTSEVKAFRTKTFQATAPKKRSIPAFPELAPSELDREQQPVAVLETRADGRLLKIKPYQALAPRKRSISALPRIAKDAPEAPKDSVVLASNPPPGKVVPDTAKSIVTMKKIETPPVAPKPKAPVKSPADEKSKEAVFTTEREDSKETTLSILFTDGRGKFYATTPQLQLMDATSGKLVKQFYRTVDASGNPDPQDIPPGTYNLLIAGRANLLMRRIVVEKDKKNRVIVKVPQGSLRFRYEDAPDRPITEFKALVTIRFEPGPTVTQACTAELEYPPGNYYIEINTMPISRFNTDIDFGGITEIQIPMPGFVQFTNTNQLGPISLYTPLGNKFVRFYGLHITGNLAAQRLQLKPGAYEVHWKKNPNMPYAEETVVKFFVRSNSITEVELR